MSRQPTLDYRRPGAIDASRLRGVRDHLARRAALLNGAVATMLLVGVPMLFLGPLILGSIFWFATCFWYGYLPWSWFFLGFVFGLIPLLFWTERRTRGTYFADAVVDSGGASPLPYAAGPEIGMLISFATSPRVSASGFVELFLTGPRLVLDATDKMRRAKQLRGVDLDRAAEVVAQLRQLDAGVPPQQLLQPGERLGVLVPVLGYLLFHDWIGVSKTGDRVWLLSDARRVLEAA